MAPKRPKGVDVFPKVVEDASPMSPSPTDLYAALDLGTNSCRMLIAQSKGSQFHVVDSFSRTCLLYTSPSPRDRIRSRMPSSA